MSTIGIALSFIVSCLGIIANCVIIVLVILTKQLNSPNRILLLHLSVVCLVLSFLYLWALINNSIIPSYSNPPVDSSIFPPSLAITTVTTTNSAMFTASSDTANSLLSSTPVSPVDISKSRVYESVSSFNDLLIHLFQPIGLWTISCINFDRYYAICSPLHYNTLLTTRKVTIFLFCGWLIIVLTIFPVYVMLIASGERIIMGVGWFKSMDVRSEWQRNHEKEFYWFEVQLLLTTVLTIFLPIILIIACNIRILTIANYQRHRIASAIYESVLSAQIAITHQKNPFPPIPQPLLNQPFPLPGLFPPPKPNPFEMQSKSQKATLVVFELLASVIVLYCPYYIFVVVFSFIRRNNHVVGDTKEQHETAETVLNIIIYIVQFLMLCAPALNAFLYGYKNKTIQENIHNYWRKQKTKIELHYEIQARTPSTCGSRKASLTEVTSNFPQHAFFQPHLKRQLSEFFFGTSSSLTSHLNDDMSTFHSNRLHRAPSDSFFHASGSGGATATSVVGRRSSYQGYLSPNFDPLGKFLPVGVLNNVVSTPLPSTSSPATKTGLSHSTSKNFLNHIKNIIVGSKNDVSVNDEDSPDGAMGGFPKILITKHSDSLLTTNSTSRRDSDIQQVATEEEEILATAENEPLLERHSLENVNQKRLSVCSRKFQTL